MIDSALIDTLDEDASLAVKLALSKLASTGIIDLQIQLVKDQLIFGSADETDDSLRAAVQESRRRITALESLKQLGTTYMETYND